MTILKEAFLAVSLGIMFYLYMVGVIIANSCP